MCSKRHFLSYAFVTYDSSEDASDATEKMNGITIFGQQIKVNVARPKEGGGGGGFGGDRRGGYNGGGDRYSNGGGRGGGRGYGKDIEQKNLKMLKF